MAGSITYSDFTSGCQYIANKAKCIGDGWLLRASKFDQHVKYLVKRETLAVEDKAEIADNEESCYDRDDLEDKDSACKELSGYHSNLITFEYHIVYSLSYSVPVLYFKATKTDGSSLSLEETWERVPKVHQHALREKWSFITQTDHPILGYPLFHVHPCNTAELMKNFTSGRTETKGYRYLLLWLSALGPLVGLKVSNEFFQV